MGNSSLERTGERPPRTGKGHGTEALGPSDSSDTGSDITGAPGLNEEEDTLHLQPGTTSDADHNLRTARKTAGPDIGDEDLDSDSDSGGTGERAAAGRDAPPATDQQLETIDMAKAGDDAMSDEDLRQELVEEDREFGDEAAADVFEEETKKKGRPMRERKPPGESSRARPHKSSRARSRKSTHGKPRKSSRA